MVFKIGANDYSEKVILDTYQVNQTDIFTEWQDANGLYHHDVYRKRIMGQFEMQISKLTEYQDFIDDVRANMQNGGFVPCKIAVNNLNQENIDADLFISYTPIASRNNNYTKAYSSFTVTVEER